MKRCLISMMIITLVCCSAFAELGWSIKKPAEKIPNTPMAGQIFGKKFELGSASLNGHALTITSKAKLDGWAESELIIFVNRESGKKEWTITPDSENDVPHVHMKFAKPGKTFPGTLMYMGEYSMKLVFTEVSEKMVKGNIHISLPDYQKSFLVGSFTAKVR